MIDITLTSGNRLAIRFPFDREVLAYVKALPDRRFVDDDGDKHWTVPTTVLGELMTGSMADVVCVDYAALQAADAAQAPLRRKYHRLFDSLQGEPSPVLIEVADKYGYTFERMQDGGMG